MAERVNDKFINFASILEWNTREQARQTATMPFIKPHLALMPDAHLGKGATVGSVIPTKGAIMPAAVGVDIGCGMMACRSQWTREDFDRAGDPRALHKAISEAIPLSPGNYNTALWSRSAKKYIDSLEALPGAEFADVACGKVDWRLQLGSLGGGNHFIEVSYDEEDRIWLFLHSGSRGVGNRIAQAHINVAKTFNEGRKLPNKDLAWLDEAQPEFDDYIRDLRWAQRFAFLNRAEMMNRLEDAVSDHMGEKIERSEKTNCHHNYTVRVNDPEWGEFWLSRKGAIDANLGRPGLIPGSMGDKSYVVEGKGNRDALWSAPHGAGRNFSRSKAKATFSRESLDAIMQSKGVTWGESDAFIDEHPMAYKPIDVVMEDAKDLVEVKHTLRQLVNVKGN